MNQIEIGQNYRGHINGTNNIYINNHLERIHGIVSLIPWADWVESYSNFTSVNLFDVSTFNGTWNCIRMANAIANDISRLSNL